MKALVWILILGAIGYGVYTLALKPLTGELGEVRSLPEPQSLAAESARLIFSRIRSICSLRSASSSGDSAGRAARARAPCNLRFARRSRVSCLR